MAFMLDDGRALDDVEPQDVARELGNVFERLSTMIGDGGPTEEAERQEIAQLLGHLSSLMRAWAVLGRWTPRRMVLAEKAAAKITRDHVQALRFVSEGTRVDEELRELAELLPDLLRHLAPKDG